jgi:Rrf2 family protein
MKLSHASAYALTYLVHLARERTDRPVPSHEAAREEGLPERFLMKVLKPLVGAGVLRSVRGPSGGYTLARAPKDVTLLDLVEAVDGTLRGDAGAVGKEGTALDRWLQAVCDAAAALARERLAKVTLADLARGK